MANTPRLGRENQRRRFCVGYAINEKGTRVALVEEYSHAAKIVGIDQPDALNGIGGLVQPRETYQRAMAREFKQKAGVLPTSRAWRLVAIVEGSDYRIHVFTLRIHRHDWQRIRSATIAKVRRVSTRRLPLSCHHEVRAFVALALYTEAVVKIDRRSI